MTTFITSTEAIELLKLAELADEDYPDMPGLHICENEEEGCFYCW